MSKYIVVDSFGFTVEECDSYFEALNYKRSNGESDWGIIFEK